MNKININTAIPNKISMNKLIINTVLVCTSLMAMTACQKPDSSNNNKPVAASNMTTDTPTQSLAAEQLNVTVQQAKYTLPACTGKGCPQVDVQQIETSYAWINQILDREILQLSSIQLSENMPKLTTLQANIDRFLQAAKADSVERGSPVPYNMQVSPSYLGQKGSLSLFKISAAFYTGGAHGSALDNYYVLDLKQKKQLKIADMLMAEQEPKLYALLHQQYVDWIKKNNQSDDLAKYEQDWPLKLIDNFSFNEKGLMFAYGQYEVGPYVVGLPEFTVAYTELEGIIKPEYLNPPLQLQSKLKPLTTVDSANTNSGEDAVQ